MVAQDDHADSSALGSLSDGLDFTVVGGGEPGPHPVPAGYRTDPTVGAIVEGWESNCSDPDALAERNFLAAETLTFTDPHRLGPILITAVAGSLVTYRYVEQSDRTSHTFDVLTGRFS